MALEVAHLFGDADGETHFAVVELPADFAPPGSTVSCCFVPVTHMTYVEYPDEASEVIPGLHPAPARQFILPLQGGFEVTPTAGEPRVFRAGDWILFDDVGSRGHLTRGLEGPPRINLVLQIEDGWAMPRP